MMGALTSVDEQMFMRAGCDLELVRRAGVERVTSEEAFEVYGIRMESEGGLVFPYFSPPNGGPRQRLTARIRQDGRTERKYLSPYGDRRHLYIPPVDPAWLNPKTPAILVEAEKSALAILGFAERHNLPFLPIALGGCWGWRGRIGITLTPDGERVEEKGPLAELDLCDGRTVYVIFDTNIAKNDKVYAAREKLIEELGRRKADVFVINLPDKTGVNGPDDLLGMYGHQEFFRLFHGAERRQSGRSPESAGGIALVTAEEFLKRSTEDEKPWLAEGLLPAASQVIWQGRPKVGKSHSLLQFVFDLASGLPAFGHFAVKRAVRCAFVELEEPEPITKARYAAMLRAHEGQGPDAVNLRFFTREDLHRMRILPRELLGGRLKDFISAFRDAGSEFVVLIALRRFLSAGESLKDPEVAERINDALEALQTETGAAIALANHTRKQEANTVEAQGFGSTFIAAGADASFEIERARDGGGRRSVRSEARFDAPEQFFLQKEVRSGEGELLRWCEAPADPNRAKREELFSRLTAGESIGEAAKAIDIPFETARRWWAAKKEGAAAGVTQ